MTLSRSFIMTDDCVSALTSSTTFTTDSVDDVHIRLRRTRDRFCLSLRTAAAAAAAASWTNFLDLLHHEFFVRRYIWREG